MNIQEQIKIKETNIKKLKDEIRIGESCRK